MDAREGARVKILIDAHLSGTSVTSREFWFSTMRHVSDLAERHSSLEILLLSDGSEVTEAPSLSVQVVDFAHRDTPFSSTAAEADVLTHICESHKVDVFVTATNSYQFTCPTVVVAWEHEQICANAVTWALGSQFVISGGVDAVEVTRDFPFIDDLNLLVAQNLLPAREPSPVEVARHIMESCMRVKSRSGDECLPFHQPGMRALIEDYQERMRRIQT